jgi:hypothetical protein
LKLPPLDRPEARDALAGNRDLDPPKHGVVLVGMLVVLQLGRKIASTDIPPDEARALEAGQEEGREQGSTSRHDRTMQVGGWRSTERDWFRAAPACSRPGRPASAIAVLLTSGARN